MPSEAEIRKYLGQNLGPDGHYQETTDPGTDDDWFRQHVSVINVPLPPRKPR